MEGTGFGITEVPLECLLYVVVGVGGGFVIVIVVAAVAAAGLCVVVSEEGGRIWTWRRWGGCASV